jgi:UDP-N-acetylglucosamine:LPS N-acetylglucosamine transferase
LKKIIIFTAGFGEGHNSAARNLCDALNFVGKEQAHAEVMDLFASCYGRLNDLARKAYIAAINKTPKLWQSFYDWLDRSSAMDGNLVLLGKMRRALETLIREQKPDIIVTTYPVYNYLIQEIFGTGPRPFAHVTVITDSLSINSIWHRAPSDYFVVPNEITANVLRERGIPEERLKVLGFPVPMAFAQPESAPPLPDPVSSPHVLFMINSRPDLAPRVVEHLLELSEIHLTVTVGRSQPLHDAIRSVIHGHEHRVTLIGWTQQMPQLLMSHHTVIGKAGGATTQESIAARCPLIITQIVPGQEEGNYETLRLAGAGLLAETPAAIRDTVRSLFADKAQRWQQLRRALEQITRPDASLRIAEFLLR